MRLNLPVWYKDADSATKEQAWKLAVEEAVEKSVSLEDFEELKSDFLKRINELLKLMAKSDDDLNKRLKALEIKVNSKKKSQLES